MYIECPNCHAEYHPVEIFIPESFLGKPSMINKSIEGKIQTVVRENAHTEDTFVCDYCNSTFKAKLNKLEFVSELVEVVSMDDDYETPLYKSKSPLPED